MEAHRTVWQCVDGCEKYFSSEDDFNHHVRTSHSELAANNMISAIKQTAVRNVDTSTRASCPVCGKHMTVRTLHRHLGHHQEQLALFALPSNPDATDYDQEGGKLSDEFYSPNEEASDEEVNEPDSGADHNPSRPPVRWLDELPGMEVYETMTEMINRIELQNAAGMDKKLDIKLTALEQLVCALKDEQIKLRAAFKADREAAEAEDELSKAREAVASHAVGRQRGDAEVAATEAKERDYTYDAYNLGHWRTKILSFQRSFASVFNTVKGELENAVKSAEQESTGANSNEADIQLKDAIGRTFRFPYRLCQTWEVCP